MSDKIAKLMREAAATIEDLQPVDLSILDELRSAAASLESAEPAAVDDAIRYGFGFQRDGKRIDPRDVYRHPPAAVPAGWKMVPVEPTWEMLKAADNHLKYKNGVFAMTDSYKAMLAAVSEDPGTYYKAMLAASPEVRDV